MGAESARQKARSLEGRTREISSQRERRSNQVEGEHAWMLLRETTSERGDM